MAMRRETGVQDDLDGVPVAKLGDIPSKDRRISQCRRSYEQQRG